MAVPLGGGAVDGVVGDELPFDELRFFEAVLRSGARCLLIGRRALILLGAPVMTQDHDLWIAVDDALTLNGVGARFGLYPTRSPEEARKTGRYVLEGDERVDVLVARGVSTASTFVSTMSGSGAGRFGSTITFGSKCHRSTISSRRSGSDHAPKTPRISSTSSF